MKKYILISFLVFISVFSFSQTDTEFWFVAPEVSATHGDDPVLLRITTTNLPADVTISMPANTVNFPNLNYNIAANTTITIDLTALGLQGEVEHYYDFLDGVNGKSNKGIRIQSTNPITCYYEVRRGNNCDIFALKGDNALGTEFYAVFQNKGYNMSGSGWAAPAYSALEIVAVEDGTTVTFESTQGQRFFGYGIGTYSVVLNRGESLSLVPDWTTDVPTGSNLPTCNLTKYGNDVFGRAGADHLSGVRITSDKNITIIKKDDSVRYYCVDGWSGGCYDLIGDQMVPLDILGFEYIAMKGSLTTAPENVYVVATEDNTNIYINGGGAPIANIDEGETYVYELWNSGNNYVHIRGDKKLSVLHVSGFGCEVGGAILPPIDKCTGSTNLSITRSTTEAFFFNLMVWSGAEDEFYIDGVLQDGSPGTLFGPLDFNPVPGSANWLIWRSGNLPTGDFPAGGTFNFQNTEDVFHLGLINGGSSSGCRFGYFSDFNELRVQAEATGSGSGEIKACGYEQIQLYSSGGTSFNWFPAEYLSDPTIATPTADPPPGSTTLFYVEVSGACGLTDTATVTVKKFPHVEAQFSVNKGNGCSLLEIEFHETSTQVNERYWDFNFSNIGGIVDAETIIFGDNNNYDTDTIFTHLFENTSNEPDDSIQNYQIRLLVKNSNDCADTAYASVIVYPEVIADFSLIDLNDTIGCNPLSVSFVDNSNNEDYYYWTFGDGVSGTMQNPVHEFTNYTNDTAIYNTRLIVRSDYFCRDTANRDITVFPYLESGFTINKNKGCSPLEVTFSNNSVYEDSVELILGDGNALYTTNFSTYSYNYENTGTTVDTNAIELRVYNDEGCIEIWRDTIIVYPRVEASFDVDTGRVCNTGPIQFTRTSPDGTHIASEFHWTFGDGSNSDNTAALFSKTYTNVTTSNQNYDVQLIAESQYGCADTATRTVMAYRALADYVLDETDGCSPLDVNITSTIRGNDAEINYQWVFDNGNTSIDRQPANPITYNNTSATVDNLTLSLTVQSNDGLCVSTKTQPITVYPEIHIDDIILSDNDVCDSVVVQFNASILNAGLPNVTYSWDFDDGSTANTNPVSHLFRNINNANFVDRTVQLEVETEYGCTDVDTRNVIVRPYVKALFTVDSVQRCFPLTVDAIATQYPGIPANNYVWTFGDGAGTHTGYNPSPYTYPRTLAPGPDSPYTLRLNVSDQSGQCTDFMEKQITVFADAKADFSPQDVSGCNPFEVQFVNNSEINSTAYLWDFKDGTTSIQENPKRIFTNNTDATKPYDVQLTAYTINGCEHDTSATINVYRYVKADFSVDIIEDCSPLDLKITNNSRGGIYRWYWDSQTAAGAEDYYSTNGAEIMPHTYLNSSGTDRTFYLTLIAENANGCTDTLTKEILVHSSINAQFTYNQPDSCNRSDVEFTNTSAGGGSYTMNWNFGDGTSLATTSNTVNKTFTNNLTDDKDFIVTMAAESENGCTDQYTDTVRVYSRLLAGISVPTSQACPPFNTTIVNTSIGNSSNQYDWYVDGVLIQSTATKTDFTHLYTNTDTTIRDYTVRMVATNPHGCWDDTTTTITVFEYVDAQFAPDAAAGCSPHLVQFANNSFANSNTNYNWNFGDATSSSEKKPDHTFVNSSRSTPRNFKVLLTVTSENYCFDTISQIITAYHQPLAKLKVEPTDPTDPIPACPPYDVTMNNFDSQGHDSFEWRFGDVANTTDGVNNITSFSYPNLNIDNIENYTLKLYVETDEGCWHMDSTVLNVYPQVNADFTMDVDRGCSPHIVELQNASSSPATQFYWNFRDGSFSNKDTVIHSFVNNTNYDRTYMVNLRATSDYNCWDTISKPVISYAQPKALFNPTPTAQKFPESTVWMNSASNNKPWAYLWEFDNIDGTESTNSDVQFFEYQHWGQKDIVLTLRSQTSDCWDSDTNTVIIYPPDVNADFTADVYSGCAPLTVNFTAAASVYNEVYDYEWDYGDGSGETGGSVTHRFDSAGVYNIKLTALSNEPGGGEDYTYKQITVYANPEAEFNISPKEVMLDPTTLEARVKFYNLSQCNDTAGCSYVWYFGDGTTAISQERTHPYSPDPDDFDDLGDGTRGIRYDVSLVATTLSGGCTDSTSIENGVTIRGSGEIEFPNAFTPDGLGPAENETFRPKYRGVIEYELLIYNRWGELIFQTKDFNVGWDGKINGEPAKPDVYVWKAIGKFTDGRAFEIAGDVTLIR